MSDVLLTHGYFLFDDEKEMQIMRPYPTLGLLYISAYLRRDGFDVEMFDSTFSPRQELYDRLARSRGRKSASNRKWSGVISAVFALRRAIE